MQQYRSVSRRTLVVGLPVVLSLTAVGREVLAQENDTSYTGAFSGVSVSWSDDWTKVDANSGADYDYVLLKATTADGGEVSLQFNVLERPWESVEEAEEFGLDSWVASFGGTKEIEEIIETWTSDEAVGFVFQEDWSGEESIQYVEFARSDESSFWQQVMLKVEDVDAGDLEDLLEGVEVDGGPVLLAADLDDISEELVEAIENQ